MAKGSQVSVFEQHAEKAVLAFCVLVLIYAAYHWVASSPRRLDVVAGSGPGAAAVPPDQVDAALSRAAKTIRDQMARAQVKPPPLPEYTEIVKQQHEEPLGWKEPIPIANLSEPRLVPDVPPPPPPPAPLTAEQMEALMPRSGKPYIWTGRDFPKMDKAEDVNLAHVVCVVPWSEFSYGDNSWQGKLITTSIPFTATVAGVIAEMQDRAPGGAWGPVRPVETVSVPRLDRAGKPQAVPEVPAFDGTNLKAVTETRRALEGLQGLILEPPYYEVWQDLKQAWVDWKVHMPAGWTGEFPADILAPKPAASAPAPAAEEVVQMPDMKKQMDAGKVLAWFHTTSLETSKEYRFRVRLVMMNPLLGEEEPDYVAPGQGRIPTVTTPEARAAWSDPVSIPKETEFFLTGSNPQAGKAKLTVFTRCLGQRVRSNFTMGSGQSIGESQAVDVVNPANKAKARRTVDFGTGAIAVQFNFDKKITRAGIAKSTTEMLYLDDSGRLRTCVLVSDMERDSGDAQRYEQLRTEVERTRRPPVK